MFFLCVWQGLLFGDIQYSVVSGVKSWTVQNMFLIEIINVPLCHSIRYNLTVLYLPTIK